MLLDTMPWKVVVEVDVVVEVVEVEVSVADVEATEVDIAEVAEEAEGTTLITREI
jgi:hypothetical protein